MSDIKILDKSIYNRIAAGEVVERPLSIVKELVENSIDAGASIINIEVDNGGLSKIIVSDNGKGVAPEDVPTAFLAHATSKIKSIEDLDKISTLGFRGEALPSIAAVSKIKMNTRTANSNTGFIYTIDNGEVIDSGFCGCSYGTTVIVSDLFDKIPARKKFLNKPSIEEAAIANMVSKLILANSEISIKYTVNGKIVYHSIGQGIDNAIYCVYGKEFFNGLLPIQSTMSDIVLNGYVCKPSASKHTKNFQTLIVNGRYVKSDELSYWIYGCYQNFLMKRQFPAYILYLTLPYDLVDVNVHPNKLEIKFANSDFVKKIITDSVKNVINFAVTQPVDIDSNDVVEIKQNMMQVPEKFDSTAFGEIKTQRIYTNSPDFSRLHDSKFDNSFQNIKFTIADTNADTKQSDNDEFIKWVSGTLQEQLEDKKDINGKNEITEINNLEERRESRASYNNHEYIQNKMEVKKEACFCGKVFNTYIIYECGDEAFLVDQHAAHERILFDKLMSDYNSNSVNVQNMLFPYTFTVTPLESQLLIEAVPLLEKYGFYFEKYDNNSFSLKSVPVECGQMDIQDFLDKLLNNVLSKTTISNADIFRDKIAQTACKSAIKGGMDISRQEIDNLLETMLNDGRILVCPHGRPIIIKITKKEIEKWFKRIV